MTSRLKNDCSNPPGRSILLTFFQIVAKRQKQEVPKFGSHSLHGFRVAANTMVVWGKNPPPPPVGNRVNQMSDILQHSQNRPVQLDQCVCPRILKGR